MLRRSIVATLLLFFVAVGCYAQVDVSPQEQARKLAYRGQVDELQQLVAKDPSLLTSVDEEGITLLHWAAFGNDPDTVAFLLDKKLDVNAREKRGVTPLMTAVWNRKLDRRAQESIVLNLLQHGADPNIAITESKITPLVAAIVFGRTGVVYLLLEAKADIYAEITDPSDPKSFGKNALKIADMAYEYRKFNDRDFKWLGIRDLLRQYANKPVDGY